MEGHSLGTAQLMGTYQKAVKQHRTPDRIAGEFYMA